MVKAYGKKNFCISIQNAIVSGFQQGLTRVQLAAQFKCSKQGIIGVLKRFKQRVSVLYLYFFKKNI